MHAKLICNNSMPDVLCLYKHGQASYVRPCCCHVSMLHLCTFMLRYACAFMVLQAMSARVAAMC